MTSLDQRLLDLGAQLDVPPAPDVAAAVLARLPDRPARRVGLHRPIRRRALALALAGLLLAGATALAVPGSRHAILRVLGLRGVTIERVPALPSIPSGEAAQLGLGRRIPLARARHAAGFTALLPPNARAAYLVHLLAGRQLSLLAGPLLVQEFRATAIPLAMKLIAPGTRVQVLTIRDSPAVYLSGTPHVVVYQGANGGVHRNVVRLAGNVLVWQDGPITVQVEGSHTLHQALALARSLR